LVAFQPSTPAKSAEVNANFEALRAYSETLVGCVADLQDRVSALESTAASVQGLSLTSFYLDAADQSPQMGDGFAWLKWVGSALEPSDSISWAPLEPPARVWKPSAGRWLVFGRATGPATNDNPSVYFYSKKPGDSDPLNEASAVNAGTPSGAFYGLVETDGTKRFACFLNGASAITKARFETFFHAIRVSD